MTEETGRNFSLKIAGEAGVSRSKKQHFLTYSGTSWNVWYRLSSRDVPMLQSQQQVGAPRCSAAPQGGRGPFGYWVCFTQSWCFPSGQGFIHPSSPGLLGKPPTLPSHAAFQGISPSQGFPSRGSAARPCGATRPRPARGHGPGADDC